MKVQSMVLDIFHDVHEYASRFLLHNENGHGSGKYYHSILLSLGAIELSPMKLKLYVVFFDIPSDLLTKGLQLFWLLKANNITILIFKIID
ncbi:hypothetical protein ACT3CD_11500 [Geofilum sp. OHC36d9]|uniref:hypothetical protein n=1 Tax=Geofilum sp. OHC36d9 TaxID=3458413 RepID=UPI0040348110